MTSQGLREATPPWSTAVFARVVGELDESVDHLPAYLEPLHLIVGRRHPLARRRTVRLEELCRSRDFFSFVGAWCADIVQIPIVDPAPTYPWSLLLNRHHPHPATLQLVRHVEAHFEPLDRARQRVPPADRARFSAHPSGSA
ncbi:hypothetical protein [Allokutzneria oryzae]|uniref:LysR substrate-binding domain-containing protein n=1 Tax=Allokutzneria oryzae TaxID=1378989 RepID=A0ABV6A681_9PSEU